MVRVSGQGIESLNQIPRWCHFFSVQGKEKVERFEGGMFIKWRASGVISEGERGEAGVMGDGS